MSSISNDIENELGLKRSNFQSTIQGKPTDLYYLKSKKLKATLCNYGARMVSLQVPDKNGKLVDITVGFASIDDYVKAKDQCYGAVVGRYAGRIAGGKFLIDDNQYQLALNNGNNAIHGGNTGFQTRVWDAEQVNEQAVSFTYVSADGEENYPGEFTTKVVYSLTDNDELKIEFEYSTTKKTVANIINHNFFNLNGEGSGYIGGHQLKIIANQFNAVNADCIPTHLANVQGTPFDFTDFHTIEERINTADEQIKNGNGYDHTYALANEVTSEPKLAAIAIGDISGIGMELYTTEPGVHFYTGNFMHNLHNFKCGSKGERRTALCLETQHFPNSPNNADAPSTVKEPGKVYMSNTIHKFYVDE
jgi:aldose 1-epimerase